MVIIGDVDVVLRIQAKQRMSHGIPVYLRQITMNIIVSIHCDFADEKYICADGLSLSLSASASFSVNNPSYYFFLFRRLNLLFNSISFRYYLLPIIQRVWQDIRTERVSYEWNAKPLVMLRKLPKIDARLSAFQVKATGVLVLMLMAVTMEQIKIERERKEKESAVVDQRKATNGCILQINFALTRLNSVGNGDGIAHTVCVCVDCRLRRL